MYFNFIVTRYINKKAFVIFKDIKIYFVPFNK